ncbi:MAG: hypothetical protein QOE70_4738 [Chthoniobacter sp.]|nr:hypothetical protein [Chthoniobacter sp.]
MSEAEAAVRATLDAIRTKLSCAEGFLESGDTKLAVDYVKEIHKVSAYIPGRRCRQILQDPDGYSAICTQLAGIEHAHGPCAREAVGTRLAIVTSFGKK